MNLTGVVEGILFVVGDEGITLNDLSETLGVDVNQTKAILKELQSEYEKDNRGIRISFLGDAFKLTTKKEHKEYYEKLVDQGELTPLSQASLETLAIIAYNQPITRAQVDEMRGVSSQYIIRRLVARNLVKASGKSDLPGRPNLYATTSDFLDYFGLSTIDDLPKLDDNNDESKETELKRKKLDFLFNSNIFFLFLSASSSNEFIFAIKSDEYFSKKFTPFSDSSIIFLGDKLIRIYLCKEEKKK